MGPGNKQTVASPELDQAKTEAYAQAALHYGLFPVKPLTSDPKVCVLDGHLWID